MSSSICNQRGGKTQKHEVGIDLNLSSMLGIGRDDANGCCYLWNSAPSLNIDGSPGEFLGHRLHLFTPREEGEKTKKGRTAGNRNANQGKALHFIAVNYVVPCSSCFYSDPLVDYIYSVERTFL